MIKFILAVIYRIQPLISVTILFLFVTKQDLVVLKTKFVSRILYNGISVRTYKYSVL